MNAWMEKFLVGLFTTWFAMKRGHAVDKHDRANGKACAESCRYTFNALLRT